MRAVIPGLPWAAAFVFGAIVSPPDAVAASAVLGKLGVPHRIRVILEGESLVNDASGLTLFGIAVAIASERQMTFPHATLEVVLLVGGGIGIGLALGWIASRVHRRLDDPLAETVITLISPYAAFLPAEAAHASGVLATVVMGLYVSRQAPHLFKPRLRQNAKAVWDTLTFVLNGLVFVLIGLQLRYITQHITDESWPRLIGQAAILSITLVVARMAWVFPMNYLRRLLRRWIGHGKVDEPSWKHLFLVAYTGMRGVISLAAALLIPALIETGEPFPQRGLIIFLTFSAILATLVVQSISLPWVVRLLKIEADPALRCEEREARLQVVDAALGRMDQIGQQLHLSGEDLGRVRDFYQRRKTLLERSDPDDCNLVEVKTVELHRRLMQLERDKLLELYDAGRINESMLARIESDLDLEELRWTER